MHGHREPFAARTLLAAALVLGACAKPPPSRPESAELGPASGPAKAPASATRLNPTVVSPASASGSTAEPALPRQAAPTYFAGGEHAVNSAAGIVVAVEEQATRVGADVLAHGGNAVDAAIATVLCLAVTHPSAASLGGGGFALVRTATENKTRAFDFRETAPQHLERGAFIRMIAAGAHDRRAIGVPGLVAGLSLLHEQFGSRPFSELLAPALRLARDGYPLPRWEANLVRSAAPELSREPAGRRIFLKNGKPAPEGARFIQRELAWTLERLATEGSQAFYRGAIAERLARALAPDGPDAADLAAYRAVEREPLSIPYRGFSIETMPPPSAGGIALLGTLLALSRSPSPTNEVDRVHLLLEAEERAQAERRFGVVDPEAQAPNVNSERRARWLDPAFWLQIPIALDQKTPSGRIHPVLPSSAVESEHTTHVSVVDRQGTAVSLTATLSGSFGSRVVAEGTGIVLNNSVASFSTSGENQPLPGRRTTSSMAPTLVFSEGRLIAVLGTPGGDTIPSTLAQLIVHLVDEQLPLDKAVEAPRWHHGFLPDQARFEPTPKPSADLLRELEKRGHKLRPLARRMGDANCIVVTPEGAAGYADSREPGVAIGGGR